MELLLHFPAHSTSATFFIVCLSLIAPDVTIPLLERQIDTRNRVYLLEIAKPYKRSMYFLQTSLLLACSCQSIAVRQNIQ